MQSHLNTVMSDCAK